TTRIVELVSAALLSFYLPIAVGAPFAAHWIVVTLFSSKYAAAASVVPVLTAAALFYSIEVLGRMTAIALGHRREIAWITGLTLVVNVEANDVAIQVCGVRGGGWTALVSDIFWCRL